jgi:Fic family protein
MIILCKAGILNQPTPHLSLYLKSWHEDYYPLFQDVRQAGTWDTWVEFFQIGVPETAEQGTATARDLTAMFDAYWQ